MPLIRSRMGLGGRFWAGENGLLKHEGTKVPGRGGAGLLRRVAPRWCWGRIAGEGLPGEAPGKPGPCGVRQGVSGNRGAWCSKSGLWKSPGFEWNPQCGRATPVSVSRPDRSPMGADTSPTPAHLPRFQGDYLETPATSQPRPHHPFLAVNARVRTGIRQTWRDRHGRFASPDDTVTRLSPRHPTTTGNPSKTEVST